MWFTYGEGRITTQEGKKKARTHIYRRRETHKASSTHNLLCICSWTAKIFIARCFFPSGCHGLWRGRGDDADVRHLNPSHGAKVCHGRAPVTSFMIRSMESPSYATALERHSLSVCVCWLGLGCVGLCWVGLCWVVLACHLHVCCLFLAFFASLSADLYYR